ncbi:MAG: NADH-quinone oxidoreductase subunit J [Actinomycetia bacterium]|nr:NADH-quinone oxidoreductase subunit J [Actinomycetes bacterium]
MNIINTLEIISFYFLSLIGIAAALRAVTGRNLFRNLIYFAVFLLCLAGLFYTLEADFIALAQVFVYVGGVVVLMMFAVMLTPQITKVIIKKDNAEIFWGYTIGITVFLVVYYLINQANFVITASGIEEATIERIGQLLMSDYLISFEVIGVILLVAIVGAIYIIKEKD